MAQPLRALEHVRSSTSVLALSLLVMKLVDSPQALGREKMKAFALVQALLEEVEE